MLYWDIGAPKHTWGVRQGDWKAWGQKDVVELYNLADDPSESKDLASQYPDKAKELTQLHAVWKKEMVASANGEQETDSDKPKLSKAERKAERAKKQ